MRIRCLAVLVMLAPLAGCIAVGNRGYSGEQDIAWHQVRERNLIEDLLWRYARTLDSADAEGYAAVYTEDGEFTAGPQSIKGRAALKQFVADLKKTREDRKARGENPGATLHMTANHRIEFTSTSTATVYSYWITVFPAAGAENPVRVGAAGRAEDKLVKIDGRWLIKVRNVGLTD